MNTKQWMFSILVLVLAIWVAAAKMHPQTMYGTTISFTVDVSDRIAITGANLVSVSSKADDYYRIYAGDSRLIGYPDEKDQFSAQDSAFPTQDWQIKDGDNVDITVKAESLVVVTKEYSNENKIAIVYVTAILTLFFLAFGNLIFLRD